MHRLRLFQWKLANHAANASGAAAHAAISAREGVEALFSFLKGSFGNDEQWGPWLSGALEEAKTVIFSPLDDAIQCNASVFGLATSLVRQNVVKEADKAIQSVLKTKLPADGFYFGNPSDAIQSSMQYAFMSSAVKSKPSTNARASFAARTSAPKRKPPSSSAASSSYAKNSGKANGRSSRGGKAGRGK